MGGGARPAPGMTIAPVAVRAARAEDIDAIVAIERASFPDPWSATSFRDLVGGQRPRLVVAECDGQVVGYWVGFWLDAEAELANIAVAASARGAGIGRRLLEDFLVRVGADTGTTVYLEVREGNAAAIALYAGHGFTAVRRRAGYYANPPEDALVMARAPGPL